MVRSVIVARWKMMSPHPPQISASYRRFHNLSASRNEMFIRFIMEEELKGDAWKVLKQMDVTPNVTVRAVCGDGIMRTQLKHYLSDTSRQEKRVGLDCPFCILKYGKLISNNMMNKDVENTGKNI